VKMMPGQTPYTPEEVKRLQALVGSAIVAVEVFGEDELEWHAYNQRKEEVKNEKLPVAKPSRSQTVIGIGALGSVRPETKPTILLSQCEPGNIFSVMARCRAAAQQKGWTQQHIGDFRGKLFQIHNNESYEAAMKFVELHFVVQQ
jgi:hypothetical protein